MILTYQKLSSILTYQMIKVIITLTFLILINTTALFCISKCNSNTVTDCGATPTACINCRSTYFTNCATTLAGTSPVQSVATITVPTLWTTNSLHTTLMTCTLAYTTLFLTYNFDFANQLVGGDSIYRVIPITTPHYQVKFRFSIAYIGVWSSSDFIWMHLNDTLQSYDVNLTYTCVQGVTTDFICDLKKARNHVDCLLNYDYTYYHNTTSLLINFTSLGLQRDPQLQFWNLFDFTIVTVNCDPSCATCYSNLPTSCFSCTNGFYLTNGNTCTSACTGGLYVLPSPLNSLTGQCVSACPQGFYLSGIVCQACPSGCLACTSPTNCITTNTLPTTSLWNQFIAVWVIIIVLGILLLIGICWRLLFYSKPIEIEEMRMIPEERGGGYEEKVTVNETIANEHQENLHIIDLDLKDHDMVDNNPRRRKRMEYDLQRSKTQF